ncbi:MAG: ATP-binding protein [Actinobacteria bacterium]|nr:ATP-binding protein [Actinomycetota bacterium]
MTGRDQETQELAVHLRERRPVAVLGPRRFGKTSLLRHALWQLDQVEPVASIWVDLYGVASVADFAVRLDKALTSVRGPLREILDTVAGGLSVRLGVLSVELRRAATSGPDPTAAAHDLLDVVVRAATRQRVVLALDEFADVAGVAGLDALLRTHLQDHYRDLGLVFAGSRPSMMRALFTDKGRPFFSQAELLEVGPLTQEAVTGLVHEGFARTNRRAGPVALRIVGFAGGHPQRCMLLADAAWQRTPEGEEATEDTWAEALAAVRRNIDGALVALYEELPPAQGRVLRAVARTGTPFAAAEARFHDLSNSSITVARDALVRDGHLARSADGKVTIVDPLFADWLTRTFP